MMENEKIATAFKAIVFLLAGTVFAIAALVTAFNTAEFLRTSLIAPGHVVTLNHGGSHPEIAFTTNRGEYVSYPQNGLIFGMNPGDKVMVRYLADNPRTTAKVDLFGSIWGWTIVAGIMGSFALIVGVQCFLKFRSPPRKR
jgi:hypothetical protein